MRVKVNRRMVPRGYRGICLWPIAIFVLRPEDKLDQTLMTHEKIHWLQQKEMFGLFFYIWYGVEYLFRYLQFGNHNQAYRNISFEREAYDKQKRYYYIYGRKNFTWIKYLRT